MTVLVATAAGCLLVWIGLRWFRGDFWRTNRLVFGGGGVPDGRWPDVVAVVPARDEAETVGTTVGALLAQDYPGNLRVVVVDDRSSDGTGAVARQAAQSSSRFRLVRGRPRPAGWTGKLWALHQGVAAAASESPDATWLWFTDADITHAPDSLRRLVGKGETEGLALVSLMVRLRCRGPWERLLIPPFIFFFQKLFPFDWVNDGTRRTAAAAGGCVLVRREVLTRAGGIAAIRDRLIDDCALAALVKPHGNIWLGHARDSVSLREYPRLEDVWRMVARSAYIYLDCATWRLVATVLGMVLLYQAPWATAIAGAVLGVPAAAALGLLAVAVQLSCYRPTLRAYGCSSLWAPTLPLAAFLYTAMTVDSARRHWLGHGGEWKGRTFEPARSGTRAAPAGGEID
jgi:hopene-associated glycosyltransferase HpnB